MKRLGKRAGLQIRLKGDEVREVTIVEMDPDKSGVVPLSVPETARR